MKRIVVGVDGSEAATAALEWAMDTAASRDADVEAVHVYEIGLAWIDGYQPDIARWEEEAAIAARGLLDAMVERAQGAHPGVNVTRTVLEGPPARTLIECAKDADLLVVGARGRGGLPGLLLGSVSNQCTHHAPCAVVVVPAPTDRT